MKYKRPLVTSLGGVHDEYFLTVPDLAAILNVDQSRARAMIADGTIRGGLRVGKLWRIPARKVREWIASTSVPQDDTVANIRARTRPRRRT